MNFAMGFYKFDCHYSFNFFGKFLALRFLDKFHKGLDYGRILDSWSFNYHARSIHLNWGDKCKILYFPWDWDAAVRWDVQKANGKFGPITHEYGKPSGCEDYADGRKIYKTNYWYELRSGEQQKRVATYHVSEMEWRWRIFRKLYKYGIKLGPKILTRSICVSFSESIGEQVGSWKGGTIGCSYEMKDGERPYQTLLRMERERKFE